jgi:hypothetical protein
MVTTAGRDDPSWRNLVADWHLERGVPDCGCDDDTSDDGFCAPSAAHADLLTGSRPDPLLAGDPDPWNHDVWVAAWGRNMPLLASLMDFPLPEVPAGLSWLVERMLIGGRRVVELVLLRTDEKDATTVLGRFRALPDPEAVVEHAERMLQQFTS